MISTALLQSYRLAMEGQLAIRSIPAVGDLTICIGAAASLYEVDIHQLEKYKGNHTRYVCSEGLLDAQFPEQVVAVANFKAMGFLYVQKELERFAQSTFLVSELVAKRQLCIKGALCGKQNSYRCDCNNSQGCFVFNHKEQHWCKQHPRGCEHCCRASDAHQGSVVRKDKLP